MVMLMMVMLMMVQAVLLLCGAFATHEQACKYQQTPSPRFLKIIVITIIIILTIITILTIIIIIIITIISIINEKDKAGKQIPTDPSLSQEHHHDGNADNDDGCTIVQTVLLIFGKCQQMKHLINHQHNFEEKAFDLSHEHLHHHVSSGDKAPFPFQLPRKPFKSDKEENLMAHL